MKSPKELEDYFMQSNKGKGNSLSFIDFIAEIQKDAYNQAIKDAVENIEYVDNDEYRQYDPNSILKLKIK